MVKPNSLLKQSNTAMKEMVNKDFARTVHDLQDECGEEFEKLNGFHESNLNYSDFVDGFIDKNTKKALSDTTIDGNANATTRDICSLMNERGKPEDKLFVFNKIFYELKKKYGLKTAKDWLDTEWKGGFYLHDAHTASFKPYCYAYDLSTLATKGEFFLHDNYNPEPAKHLDTFIDHVIEFIGYMSNRTSGAVGIPNVLVWTYYFWKKDVAEGHVMKNKDYYIRQEFQKLVYRFIQQFLRVDQSAFTNVSIFDKYYAEAIFGGMQYPDGSCFSDDVPGFLEHEKVVMELVSEIRKTNMFTFPVLTMSLLKRKDITEEEKAEMLKTGNWNVFKDAEFAKWCSDHNTEWYDSNFFMADNTATLSSCCRLLNDTTTLKGFINGVGGTGLSIGSVKVNTMNLVHIAYDSEHDRKKYLALLKKRTIRCCKTLDTIRHVISRNVEKGLLPNYCEGGIDIAKQYCTIGILGMYETLKEFGYVSIDKLGYATISDEGMEFAKAIFAVIKDVKENFTQDYSFNIESVPAERAAVILAQKDTLLYGNKEPMYSNQWIPLSQKTSIEEKLRTAAVLDNLCSGGAIAHVNIEKSFPSKKVAWDTLNKIALTGVIYFAFNTKIPTCKNNHAMAPGSTTCPVCGEPVADYWTRIVGFYRPVNSFSSQRKIEYGTRQWWDYIDSLNELAYSK